MLPRPSEILMRAIHSYFKHIYERKVEAKTIPRICECQASYIMAHGRDTLVVIIICTKKSNRAI